MTLAEMRYAKLERNKIEKELKAVKRKKRYQERYLGRARLLNEVNKQYKERAKACQSTS